MPATATLKRGVANMKGFFKNILLYMLLFLGGLFMVLPFYWMLVTSLKSAGEAIAIPPTWLPRN